MISCSKQFLGIPTNGLYECIMNDFSGDFMLVILDVTSNEQIQFVNLLMTSQSVFLNNGTTRFRRSLNFLWRLLNLQIIILQVWRGYIILRYKRNGIIWRKYLSVLLHFCLHNTFLFLYCKLPLACLQPLCHQTNSKNTITKLLISLYEHFPIHETL